MERWIAVVVGVILGAGCQGEPVEAVGSDAALDVGQPADARDDVDDPAESGDARAVDDGASSSDSAGATETATGERTAIEFPSSTSTARNATNGMTGSPFAIGYCRTAGDYVEELFSRAGAARRLILDVPIRDGTSGCGIGATHKFAVLVGSTKVGELSFVGSGGGVEKRLKNDFAFGPIEPNLAGKLRIRIEAATTVCVGGGTWGWLAGGSGAIE